ncbi:MAG TPA: heme ABC exporter ATP-binding protein CcmA [Candidatus Limnocylindria bacterium]|nr:heme ABC exporter ATP-binding protein CcmA [Candidatus Limnocylindria bacterium]
MPTTIFLAPPRRALEAPSAADVHDLARLFGRSAALAGITLAVEPGRCIALLGPNGAGKTTLLRVLATLLRPTYGTARVDGLDVTTNGAQVRERVAFLSHATGLYGDLTARENLAFAATMLGLERAEARQRIPEVLDAVGLRSAADRRVAVFSAGMRRRLAIGRTILGRPSLVLLDEPHAALDADGQALVGRLLAGWREVGVTTLVASHHADLLGDVVDGSVTLANGLVTEIAGQGVHGVTGAGARTDTGPGELTPLRGAAGS